MSCAVKNILKAGAFMVELANSLLPLYFGLILLVTFVIFFEDCSLHIFCGYLFTVLLITTCTVCPDIDKHLFMILQKGCQYNGRKKFAILSYVTVKGQGNRWTFYAISLPLPPRTTADWPPTCALVTANEARRYLAPGMLLLGRQYYFRLDLQL